MSNFNIPDSPRSLGIPKDHWREGQKETVEAVLDAFMTGVKFVMLSAPTGAGKSVVAAAVQKLLAGAGGVEGKSIALTHTIQLQQQYVETLPDAEVLSGRANYDCDLPPGHEARLGFPDLNAEDAPCGNGEGCPIGLNRRGGCGYYQQFWDAADAPMVVLNYAYAVRVLQQEYFATGERDISGRKVVMKNPFRRSLLVADECHLSERAIVEAAGLSFPMYLLKDLHITLPPEFTKTRVTEGRTVREYETTGVWVHWANEHLEGVQEEAKKATTHVEYLTAQPERMGGVEILAKARLRAKRINALLDHLTSLAGIDALHYSDWLVSRSAYSVVARPLYGWSVAHTLWQWFDRVLIMSATPGDPDIERVKLGIPKDNFVFIERPSVFPVENRPVIYWPIAKLNYNSSEEDWQRIGAAIHRIATSGQWADRKGLVHSGSKANAARLVTMLNRMSGSQRYFTHGDKKGDAIAALERFKSAKEPLVMVTASFTTGLDLPYLIGWQVIAKVPFGSLADDITARRRAFKDSNGVPFGQRVYQSEAMNTVVQAAGRIVRAVDDSGPTFILDGNYEMLHRLAWKPGFYSEAYKRLSLAD